MCNDMILLGPIVRLQVQEASLKVGQPPRQRYVPAPLRAVPALEVTVDGVRGVTDTGEFLLDVHHRGHPSSKNRRGVNGISLGFTSHYDAMRAYFGPHLTDGIAGENLLIATDQVIGEEDLAPGLAIVTSDGNQVLLMDIVPAAPCAEFSRFALRFPEDKRSDGTVTEALQFLSDGVRGYYARYHGPATRIAVGNLVYLCQGRTW